LGLVVASFLAGPASALPVTVFFEGSGGFGLATMPDGMGPTSVAFTVPVTASTPVPGQEMINLDLDSGALTNAFSILDYTIVETPGSLGVLQELDPSSVIVGSAGQDSLASITWTVDNLAPGLLGATYLMFVTGDPFQGTQYADANVGITIDSELGWVLIPVQSFLYPAILLGAPLGDQPVSFELNYVLRNEPLQANPDGMRLFPQLRVAVGFTPVPEPGPAVLLGLGVLAIGVHRRLRS
jgi:hypothetical protein